jgi:hypothetical protein
MLGRLRLRTVSQPQQPRQLSCMAGSDLILVSKDDQIVAEVLEYVFE